MEFVRHALDLPVFTLFLVVALGLLLGQARVGSISLGAAGVLFVGLLFGHFGRTVPAQMRDLGLVLFVYAVGLQAGPRFFGILRARGTVFLGVALASTTVGAIATLALARGLQLPPALATGLYTGATTSTPALAAAIDVVSGTMPQAAASVSVGYGLAYPLSVIGLVVFVQALPAVLRTSGRAAAEQARADEERNAPPIDRRTLRVTNPNCDDRRIDDLQSLHISSAKISRVKHADVVHPARPEERVHLNDVVVVVGEPGELDKIEALIGSQVDEPMTDPSGNVASEEVVISRADTAGRTLRGLGVWEEFGVVVTRVRREGIEFSPAGTFVLELGDVLRVVGSRADLDRFADRVGREERRLDETTLLPFGAGLALGVAAGLVPIPMPAGLRTTLGVGGGTLLVGLLLGHIGHIGPVRMHVPNAAKYLARELGLVIFLAGAGTEAGERFIRILSQTGPQLLAAGILVAVVTMLTALVILHGMLRWNMLSTAGALCGCMTDTAGLAAATRLADSDAAAVAFASVYPVALICKIVLAQALFVALRALN